VNRYRVGDQLILHGRAHVVIGIRCTEPAAHRLAKARAGTWTILRGQILILAAAPDLPINEAPAPASHPADAPRDGSGVSSPPEPPQAAADRVSPRPTAAAACFPEFPTGASRPGPGASGAAADAALVRDRDACGHIRRLPPPLCPSCGD